MGLVGEPVMRTISTQKRLFIASAQLLGLLMMIGPQQASAAVRLAIVGVVDRQQGVEVKSSGSDQFVALVTALLSSHPVVELVERAELPPGIGNLHRFGVSACGRIVHLENVLVAANNADHLFHGFVFFAS